MDPREAVETLRLERIKAELAAANRTLAQNADTINTLTIYVSGQQVELNKDRESFQGTIRMWRDEHDRIAVINQQLRKSNNELMALVDKAGEHLKDANARIDACVAEVRGLGSIKEDNERLKTLLRECESVFWLIEQDSVEHGPHQVLVWKSAIRSLSGLDSLPERVRAVL